jgi:endonuclease/exonuclease/phosphatase family metal-dependent hydrolase
VTSTKGADSAPIRLIAWNVHGSASPRLDAVVDLMESYEPDVVALQEVRHNQARRIAGLLRWRAPVWALKHNAYWPLWWKAEGLAVLSRHDLAAHPPVVLTPEVSRRTFRRRILLPVEIVLPEDRRVLLIDAHLSSEATDDERRLDQAGQLVALVPDTFPVIVAGDLNTVPDTPPIAALARAGFADAWVVANPALDARAGFTSPANAPRHRIDYVLSRDMGRVVEAAVIDDLGPAMAGLSDHRPVLAVLDLPPAAADAASEAGEAQQ